MERTKGMCYGRNRILILFAIYLELRKTLQQESKTTVLNLSPAVIALFITAICITIFDSFPFVLRSRLSENIPSFLDITAVAYCMSYTDLPSMCFPFL